MEKTILIDGVALSEKAVKKLYKVCGPRLCGLVPPSTKKVFLSSSNKYVTIPESSNYIKRFAREIVDAGLHKHFPLLSSDDVEPERDSEKPEEESPKKAKKEAPRIGEGEDIDELKRKYGDDVQIKNVQDITEEDAKKDEEIKRLGKEKEDAEKKIKSVEGEKEEAETKALFQSLDNEFESGLYIQGIEKKVAYIDAEDGLMKKVKRSASSETYDDLKNYLAIYYKYVVPSAMKINSFPDFRSWWNAYVSPTGYSWNNLTKKGGMPNGPPKSMKELYSALETALTAEGGIVDVRKEVQSVTINEEGYKPSYPGHIYYDASANKNVLFEKLLDAKKRYDSSIEKKERELFQMRRLKKLKKPKK